MTHDVLFVKLYMVFNVLFKDSNIKAMKNLEHKLVSGNTSLDRIK